MLGIVLHGVVMMPREKRQVEKDVDRERMLLTVIVDGFRMVEKVVSCTR